MTAEPNNTPRNTLFGIAAVLVPLVTAFIAAMYARASIEREVGVRFVEMAAEILREAPKPATVDLREWAADVIDNYSGGVKLSERARRALVDSIPLTAAVLDRRSDIKVNGLDGPVVVINAGEPWSYSWSSLHAVACQLMSPTGPSGITLAGNDGPIPPNHPWYPRPGTFITLLLSCTDGSWAANDAIVVYGGGSLR